MKMKDHCTRLPLVIHVGMTQEFLPLNSFQGTIPYNTIMADFTNDVSKTINMLVSIHGCTVLYGTNICNKQSTYYVFFS
jgi:hypothetical protein